MYNEDEHDNKHVHDDRYKNRTTGTVCGLDPYYCDETAQIWPDGKIDLDNKSFWVDDIIRWPMCSQSQVIVVREKVVLLLLIG